MFEYDPVSSLRHFPLSLDRFGKNVYGEPLYRIVWGPSRRYLVCGEWPDGSNCARWAVKYKQCGENWILEGWMSAQRFAQCSRQQWERDKLSLGPWPERGEYEIVEPFYGVQPSDSLVEKLINWSRAGSERISPSETFTFNRDDAMRELAEKENIAQAMLRNALPAFGPRPFAGAHVSRGEKTRPILHSAEELGLPMCGGPMAGSQVRRMIANQESAAA